MEYGHLTRVAQAFHGLNCLHGHKAAALFCLGLGRGRPSALQRAQSHKVQVAFSWLRHLQLNQEFLAGLRARWGLLLS